MTVQELKKHYPSLQTDAEETGVYLKPIAGQRFSFQSFPVGQETEDGFKPDEDAVLITADQFVGLRKREMCWSDEGTIVPFVKSQEVLDAEAFIAEFDGWTQRSTDARKWLADHDYIGIKIAEALVSETDDVIVELRKKYAAELETAKTMREIVSENEDLIAENKNKYEEAQQTVRRWRA